MRRLLSALAWSAALLPAAQAADNRVDTAALRCSAVSMLHSSLTIPSPQFGELMVQIAGLFAEIYSTQRELQGEAKLSVAELKSRRDGLLAELRQGWPANKDKLIREAATCNAWRIAFFVKLPDKPTEKAFRSALARIDPPPAEVAKTEIDDWARLTSEAMGAAAVLGASPKKK